MNAQTRTWMMEKTIHSEMDQAHKLVETIIGQLDSEGWNCREQFQIQMAVEESITNAIEHGNKRDATKTVKVACHINNHEFLIMIEDQGRGFDRDSLADCTQEDRIDQPRGRGVMLIESFMSEVEFLGCGNIVRMKRVKDDPKFIRPPEDD